MEKLSGQPLTYEFVVTDLDIPRRLDVFLHHQIPSYSRSFFQTLIAAGNVKINNKIISKPSYNTKGGDTILVTLTVPPIPPSATCYDFLNNFNVKIIFTHEHFFIIEKPAGLIIHKTSTQSEATLVDWLLYYCHEIKKVGNVERPGIVHRLDKDTSGLLIIARTNYAHTIFGDMFKNRTIHKTYYAVVEGTPPAEGIINFPIARHSSERHRMTHKIPSGRSAITHYKTITYFKNHALLELKPITGRTHQIRVHCAAIGHPLVGDKVYGSSSKLIGRHALHAGKISFAFDGQDYNFNSPLPEDFEQLLKKLASLDQ
jgi:23S rRNA pseudouridine1911/1915/1917 synthase